MVIGLIEMIIIIVIVKNRSDYRATIGIFVVLVVMELINEILNLRIFKKNVYNDKTGENQQMSGNKL